MNEYKCLTKPFSSEDVEWRLQKADEQSMQGLAVPYLTNRAIQNRLDEIFGPFGWRNEYAKWGGDSQLCTIFIKDPEGNWIGKTDGADNSEIECVKGGLSDAMKRAAVQWGIGRYLYNVNGVWVDIEKRGKSYTIKKDQYGKLDLAYNRSVFGSAMGKESDRVNNNADGSVQYNVEESIGYKVSKVESRDRNGNPSEKIIFTDISSGNMLTAFVDGKIRGTLKEGMKLKSVDLLERTTNNKKYYVLTGYAA